MTRKQDAERQEAIRELREMLPPGTEIRTILRHVSRSGMQRQISLHVLRDGELRNITGMVGTVLGYKWGDYDGLKVSGAGMDMGFHVVYNLSRTLYPHGHGCIGERCPSNDHSNGDRSYVVHAGNYAHPATPKTGQTGDHLHNDGGYALRHRWI